MMFSTSIGDLAPSRALGDFLFKQNSEMSPEEQAVTANPEITIHDITEEDEFLVIACDGKTTNLLSQKPLI